MKARLLQLLTVSLIAITFAGCAGTGARTGAARASFCEPAAGDTHTARSLESCGY